MADGATAKFARRGPPPTTTGWPDRQNEAPQVELLANSGSEPGATRARFSSNRPLEQPGTITGLSQGWAGPSPSQSRARPITSDRTPAADVDVPRSFTRWANRNCSVCFTLVAPLRRPRCPWLVSPPSTALATVPFPSRMVGRFAEAPISCSTRRAGLSDGKRPHRTTSGPRLLMSQWPSSTGAQCRS